MRPVGSRGEYPYDDGKHLIAMGVLHAYGDDSGTHQDANVCLVLGYIGSPRQWKLFRREWQAALAMLPQREGKTPEFHAKEFFQRARWRSHESPYHRWTKAKAETFLNSLLDAIHRHQLEPIGGATNTRDFFAYSEPQRRFLTGAALITTTRWHGGEFEITDKLLEHQSAPNRPYFVTFPGFLVEAMEARSAIGDSQVHIYLDRKRESEARALEVFNAFKTHAGPEAAKLTSLTFIGSEEEDGLQAADLYAYVWYRKLTHSMNSELSRAFGVLTRKRTGIRIVGKRYFDSLLDHAIRGRADEIRKGFSGQS